MNSKCEMYHPIDFHSTLDATAFFYFPFTQGHILSFNYIPLSPSSSFDSLTTTQSRCIHLVLGLWTQITLYEQKQRQARSETRVCLSLKSAT